MRGLEGMNGGAPMSPGGQGSVSDGGMGGGGMMSPMSRNPWGISSTDGAQKRVFDLQRKCSAGDGRACHELQIAQQQLGMAQQQQQNQIGFASRYGKAGTMGTHGRGGRTPQDVGWIQNMLQGMYGGGGSMGGGGMGSSNMGWG
jgi:hypothetical protein